MGAIYNLWPPSQPKGQQDQSADYPSKRTMEMNDIISISKQLPKKRPGKEEKGYTVAAGAPKST
jgi:hypothetical protein